MKRTEEGFDRLIAELEADIADLEKVERRNKLAMARIESGARDELDWAALGYTIHNIYGTIEGYCLRVAKFFENDVESLSWHRELLQRMRLDIEKVRPALLDEDTVALVDELRGFRHVFRHLYARALDPERVEFVQRKVGPAIAAFRRCHTDFVDKLLRIRALLAEPESRGNASY